VKSEAPGWFGCRMNERLPGLFITGTGTGVGKSYVGAMIARQLAADGRRVGVYKPAASGCRTEGGRLVCDDAIALWEAAGRPGQLARVCPQCFQAPLAPHLAARAEGRQLDPALLRSGLDYWLERSDFVLVEGAGGLMSPLGDEQYVADLAEAFAWPLVVVAENALGVINATLQTLVAAAAFGGGLPVAGVVLNRTRPPGDDPSLATNRQELSARSRVPILAEVVFGAERFDVSIDWLRLAGSHAIRARAPGPRSHGHT
jgi:dethiobiotin synthetase